MTPASRVVHLSMHLSVCMSVHLYGDVYASVCVCVSFGICLCICLLIRPCICLCIYICTFLYICLFYFFLVSVFCTYICVCLYICLCICLCEFKYLSAHQPVHLSVYLPESVYVTCLCLQHVLLLGLLQPAHGTAAEVRGGRLWGAGGTQREGVAAAGGRGVVSAPRHAVRGRHQGVVTLGLGGPGGLG